MTISLADARRMALKAQGFGQPPPVRPTAAHLRKVADSTGLFQIDSVNVLPRAHYLPAFSRLGGCDRSLLEGAAWGPKRQRRFFEYWAHVGEIVGLA